MYRILFFRRPGDGERKRRFVRGEPFVSERLFLSKTGANPQKGGSLPNRPPVSSVLGPQTKNAAAIGSGGGLAAAECLFGDRGRHCAGERLCRDVRRFCPYAFGPVAGSAGQRKKIAEYDIRIPFRHRSGRSLCGGGRAEAEDFRRVSVQVRVQKTRRQKTLPPRAFRSAVARRCGYFLEERYSFTTL